MKSERMKKTLAWISNIMKYIIICIIVVLAFVAFVNVLREVNEQQIQARDIASQKVAQKYINKFKQKAVDVGHAHYKVNNKGIVSFVWNVTQPTNIEVQNEK